MDDISIILDKSITSVLLSLSIWVPRDLVYFITDIYRHLFLKTPFEVGNTFFQCKCDNWIRTGIIIIKFDNNKFLSVLYPSGIKTFKTITKLCDASRRYIKYFYGDSTDKYPLYYEFSWNFLDLGENLDIYDTKCPKCSLQWKAKRGYLSHLKYYSINDDKMGYFLCLCGKLTFNFPCNDCFQEKKVTKCIHPECGEIVGLPNSKLISQIACNKHFLYQ